MSRAGVFCDYNAGAPPLPEVVATFAEIEATHPANPSSAHTPGRAARALLEAARARIAAVLGLPAEDVLFTSGGTESANLAVLGLGDASRPVLMAEVEHPAVAESAAVRGIVRWSVDAHGCAIVVPPAVPVGLLALTHAQGEIGTLQPVGTAIALAEQLGVPCFVDASQTLGRVALEEPLQGGAIVALSPHKCGGLRGFGVLAGRELAARLRPLLRGGGQELGLRPGTQSPALAAANALAIERAILETPKRAAAMAANRSAFRSGLSASGVLHEVLTPLEHAVPNTLMVRFESVEGRSLLPALDLDGVYASHGSACSSGAPTPPRVLLAMGLDEATARACVRFSFGWLDARGELDVAARRAGARIHARQKKS
jgi:cysteine desulfurase